MSALEEALSKAGDGDAAMLRFFEAFLAAKLVVPAAPGPEGGPARPRLLPADGRPGALAYVSREVCRDPAPNGAALTEMDGADLVIGLEEHPLAQLVLVVSSGETRAFPAEFVGVMRALAQKARREVGGRPEALVQALKEALARSPEAAGAAFAEGAPAGVVVKMQKGQEAAFKYVEGDLRRAAEEAGFELTVFPASAPGSPAPEPQPFYGKL